MAQYQGRSHWTGCSKLGWVLSGPAACPTSTESCTVNVSSTHVLIESAEISGVQKFWDLETLGIKENEALVYEKFSNDIRFTGEELGRVMAE